MICTRKFFNNESYKIEINKKYSENYENSDHKPFNNKISNNNIVIKNSESQINSNNLYSNNYNDIGPVIIMRLWNLINIL